MAKPDRMCVTQNLRRASSSARLPMESATASWVLGSMS